MQKKSTFCVLPWIHSFVNNGGEYQVCCTGEEYKNYILNEMGKPFYLQDSPKIEDVMNSSFLKEFRLKMLNGQMPSSCERCVKTECLNGHSRRLVENNKYKDIVDQLILNTHDDGSIDIKILDLDYRLGNSCNLTCRMCNPRASKNWVKQHKIISEHLQDEEFKKNVDVYLEKNWSQTELLDQELKTKIKDVEKLHFGGGEPLYASRMKDLLLVCIELGVAKNISLSYNTNLTLLPQELTELWNEFKEVKLIVSLDGVGKVNDYIRYPSKFSRIDENLKKVDKEYREMNISEVLISTTVQINNVFHLKDLYSYLQGFNFINKVPNLILLYFPDFLQANILPRKLAALALMKINDLISFVEANLDASQTEELQNLYQLKKYFSQKYKPELQEFLFNNFMNFSLEFDQGKNLDFLEVNPEFRTSYNDFLKKTK